MEKKLQVPQPTKDGWFKTADAKPPMHRTVFGGKSQGAKVENVGEFIFIGTTWMCGNEISEAPEFWKVK